jgi:hypothetical protein
MVPGLKVHRDVEVWRLGHGNLEDSEKREVTGSMPVPTTRRYGLPIQSMSMITLPTAPSSTARCASAICSKR